jgi:FlaG/FlaF family flagellin (archaellin)
LVVLWRPIRSIVRAVNAISDVWIATHSLGDAMNFNNSDGSIEGEVVSGKTMIATLTPHDVPGGV